MMVQGLYILKRTGVVYYVAFNPAATTGTSIGSWLFTLIKPGTSIKGYHAMGRLPSSHALILLKECWLSNDIVVSDLYPEFFI